MKIKSWWFKNIASYGNTKETINISDKGELILISAKIGSGKTSLISSLDIALFGEVQNKQGKRLPQKNIPNRTNGHMECGVIFENSNLVQIERSMESSSSSMKTKLIVDKIPYGKATKIDETIEEKIGFDYKTYKSFISMNINNFKNFISLTPDDKRLLLDKLFNLEIINELNKILKQLVKNNDNSFNSIKNEIKIYRDNITELKETIENVNKQNINDKANKILLLKEILQNNKDKFIKLEEKKEELEVNISEFDTSINGLNTKLRDINRDIRDIEKMIELYNSGKCPTCHTELTGDLNLLPEYNLRLEKTFEIKKKISDKINKGTDILREYKLDLQKINTEYTELFTLLTETKSEIKTLNNTETTDLSGFDNQIENLETKVKDKEKEYLETQKYKYIYEILSPIWSENGIKRDIIESIINPLNEYIKEDLVHLKTRFKVELDNNFDAHVYEFNNEIDPDTLSTGEGKTVNIIIMLAYLKILRSRSDINVLFLDEVFSNFDIETCENVLLLFRKFSHERNISIFLVHHSELKEHYFDRILNIKKGTFSYIE